MSNCESISHVDLILSKDPAGAYPSMEFATRNYYCRVVERIAMRAKALERDVAQQAIELASKSHSIHPNDEHFAHVGYYLIDAGRADLEEIVGYKPSWPERFSRTVRRRPANFCMGLLLIFTASILVSLNLYAYQVGAPSLMLVWLSLLFMIPASELALNALDAVIILRPSALPKMDFASGIPDELLTMVVVPAIFSSEATVHELLETIESHYLANQDDCIFFALLGDWSDAPEEKTPHDDAILDVAMNGVKALNERHHIGSRDRFYLFHRRRMWNQSEEKWIGWERKRGKLREFNKLLRGARDTSYIVCAADQAFLAQVRYVITLDADTRLTCNAARRLVGTIAHPLNRPKLDPSTGRVKRGYVVIQPHMGALPPCASFSLVPRILPNYICPDTGVKTIPCAYQDLFGEGHYVGKGLYDVDAFEAVLNDRVPENTLLSHDLFEGIYARTALVTDVVFLESRRLYYESSMKMLHRWTRGDWQVLPWLMPHVRNSRGISVRNALPMIARWKILDNMRRTLFPPAMLLWLITAWVALPGSPTSWTLLVLLTLALSHAIPLAKGNLLLLLYDAPRFGFWGNAKYIVKTGIIQTLIMGRAVLFTVVMLADQSYLRTDAALRALYRMFISHKRLLEWDTTAQAQSGSRHDLFGFFRLMWPAVMITFSVAALIFIINASAYAPAAPFLLAWLMSPVFAYLLNRNVRMRNLVVEQVAEQAIRLKGRRMWGSVGCFIDEENHRPPPDNYQGKPAPNNVDHTPATNGLRLPLWMVTAHDLGWIGTIELADCLESALARIVKSRSLNGYHLNYGKTQTPALAAPRRMLELENGNLAGHFTLLQQLCARIANRPLFNDGVIKGVADAISLLREEVAHIGKSPPIKRAAILRQLREEIDVCAALLPARKQEEAPRTLSAWNNLFNSIARHAAVVDDRVSMLLREHGAVNGQLRVWSDSLARQSREFNRDLRLLAPWISVPVTHLKAFIIDSGCMTVEEWTCIAEFIDDVPTVSQLLETSRAALGELIPLRPKISRRAQTAGIDHAEAFREFEALVNAIEEALEFSGNLLWRYARIEQHSKELMEAIDFRALFDEERKILLMNLQGYSISESEQTTLAYLAGQRT